jgi:hypothetical protein
LAASAKRQRFFAGGWSKLISMMINHPHRALNDERAILAAADDD